MTISFIVLNWHNEAETTECIESLRDLKGDDTKQIIIVDNESTEDSYRGLQSLSGCIIVRNATNLGFAGGVNSALPHVTGEAIALINNDCVVEKNWLVNAKKILFSSKNIGAVGGKEFFWNSDNPVWDTTNDCLSAPLINAEYGYPLSTNRDLGSTYVAGLMGSNMLLRADLFQKLGGFDEDFFAYCEETDLCTRIIASGYKLVYSPTLAIWHKRNLSSNKVPFLKYYLSSRNKIIFIAKNYPDNRWRRMVFDAGFHSFRTAITGTKNGIVHAIKNHQELLSLTERRANLAAAWWALTHQSYLRKKRSTNKQAGSFDNNLPRLLHELQDEPKSFTS